MAETNPYTGREQTKTKHFILKTYLQALAFKVLGFSDVTYVDGFSGPWETRTESFTDSSFMIAINVLKDAQQQVAKRGVLPRIRCFFCERDRETFKKLQAAVVQYHRPDQGFEIQTYCGEFTDAVTEISAFVGTSFALIFIDSTGWIGYGIPLIKPLLIRRKTEVIINFMYDFVNRAAGMSDPKTIASLNPILGGEGWSDRLDPVLAKQARGAAVEKLFRETLQMAGQFEFIISTKIYRTTIDRLQFSLIYGTKDKAGLKTYRETEYIALKKHAADRFDAKERKREEVSGSADLFYGMGNAVQSAGIDQLVSLQKEAARGYILTLLSDGPKSFANVWPAVLQRFVLRETNVKDICVALFNAEVLVAIRSPHLFVTRVLKYRLRA